MEMFNEPGATPTEYLLNVILPEEIQKPMPNAALQQVQQKALADYWKYVKLADLISSEHRLAHVL